VLLVFVMPVWILGTRFHPGRRFGAHLLLETQRKYALAAALRRPAKERQ
jgi:hypothetical protein